MAFTEDHTAYFDTNGMAVSATYTPDGGDAVTVNGIFDNEYFDDFGTVGVEESAPKFLCAASDVSGVAQGDALVVNTVTYSIVNIQHDGTGQTLLILEDQS